MSDPLKPLIDAAMARFNALSPEEQAAHRRAQNRSYVIAEAAMGSDKDERDLRDAIQRGDGGEISRLKFEASLRAKMAEEHIDGRDALVMPKGQEKPE